MRDQEVRFSLKTCQPDLSGPYSATASRLISSFKNIELNRRRRYRVQKPGPTKLNCVVAAVGRPALAIF